MATLRAHGLTLMNVALLAVLWGVAAWTGFDAFPVVIAAAATVRMVVLDLRGYRVITRGRSWWPSKDPADYR